MRSQSAARPRSVISKGSTLFVLSLVSKCCNAVVFVSPYVVFVSPYAVVFVSPYAVFVSPYCLCQSICCCLVLAMLLSCQTMLGDCLARVQPKGFVALMSCSLKLNPKTEPLFACSQKGCGV